VKRLRNYHDPFATYRLKLRIDKNDLDETVIKHPELLEEVSTAFALAVSKRDQAKTEMERCQAELTLKYRRRANKAGERITNDEIASRVINDQTYVLVHDVFLTATKDVAQWQALKEAFISRGYMIRELCSLYASNYFNSTSVKVGGTQYADERSLRNAAKAILPRRTIGARND